MLLTAVGIKTGSYTKKFSSPRVVSIDSVYLAVPEEGGTEVYDALGKYIVIVQETPEQIEEKRTQNE